MSEEEINEALKIIKEPIIVNSIEYKYFNQKNYEKLLSVYENAKWFVSNWEQALQNINNLQQKVKQLEKENEYLKMSNPEQNMEHFRIVNENKRKIDMLRKENHQLENIRKEIKEYIEKNVACFKNGDMLVELNVDDLLNILNKGDNIGRK